MNHVIVAPVPVDGGGTLTKRSLFRQRSTEVCLSDIIMSNGPGELLRATALAAV